MAQTALAYYPDFLLGFDDNCFIKTFYVPVIFRVVASKSQ